MAHSRLDLIKEYITQHSEVSVAELSDAFGVSVVTIRKDLDVLQRDGFILRRHGKAILLDSLNHKQTESSKLSDRYEDIARLAVEHVQPGDFIFLGSGSTCMALADKLRPVRDLSVITNNVSAATVLIHSAKSIILLGGELMMDVGGTVAALGPNVAASLDGVYVDKAFTSGVGIDCQAGLTVNKVDSTYIDKHIPDFCGKWILMMDKEKFGVRAFYQAASLDKISCLITDETDGDILQPYRDRGLEIFHP